MIAATTYYGSLEFFSAVYGTGNWSSEPVGPQGQLLLDYSAFGSGIWYSEPVPGNGSGPNQ
jgi:hypothetical protein